MATAKFKLGHLESKQTTITLARPDRVLGRSTGTLKAKAPPLGVRGSLLGKRGIGDRALPRWVCGLRKRFNGRGFGSVALVRAVCIERVSEKDADAEERKQGCQNLGHRLIPSLAMPGRVAVRNWR